MKFTLQKLILPLLAIFLCAPTLHAQVYAYNIFKVANYAQTSPDQPASVDSPNAYYLGAQLNADTNDVSITNADFELPDGTTYPMTGNPVPTYYTYNTDYYPDLESLDADYPPGDYEFLVNSNSDSGELSEPSDEVFTASIPYFTGNTWNRLQNVNAARPLKLCWNDFVPDPDATSAFIFVRVLDPYYNYVYTTNFLAYTNTGICIPAYTLEANDNYTIQLLFSDRIDDVNYGFESGAPATAGFDVLTYTTSVTGPPQLSIAPGTNSVILTWPVSPNNFQYQVVSTCMLSTNINWQPVYQPVTISGNTNIMVVPETYQTQFFELGRRIVLATASAK